MKEGEDVTVIGHTHDDYAGFADSVGARRFRVPNDAWTWEANAKWVEEQIAARRPILLVTPLDEISPRLSSATRRELMRFRDAGYEPSSDGLRLVPPGVR